MVDLTKTEMTAAEFLDLPETNKIVELINGEVVVAPSPVDRHQQVSGNLYFSLRQQIPSGTWRFAPADVYLDEYNVVQPDLFWIGDDNDHCHLVDGKYWRGAPDLVIEVLSPGTTRQDRDVKYRLYEAGGVREYWIVDAAESYVEVYRLTAGQFARYGIFGVDEQFVSPLFAHVTLRVEALLSS